MMGLRFEDWFAHVRDMEVLHALYACHSRTSMYRQAIMPHAVPPANIAAHGCRTQQAVIFESP
jgi:dihydroorotase